MPSALPPATAELQNSIPTAELQNSIATPGSCMPHAPHAQVQTQGLKTHAGVDGGSRGLLVFASARHQPACKRLAAKQLPWALASHD